MELGPRRLAEILLVARRHRDSLGAAQREAPLGVEHVRHSSAQDMHEVAQKLTSAAVQC